MTSMIAGPGWLEFEISRVRWNDVDRVPPPQRTVVMVCGPSGWANRKFMTLAYLDEEFRPTLRDGEPRWLDVQNDQLADCDWKPTHWAHVMELP